MTNEVEVYFAIRGDEFDPDEFTRQSGLTPSFVYRRGEPGVYVERYKFSQWALSSGHVEGDDLLIGEIADHVIEQLVEHADLIAHTVAQYDLYAVLQVDVYPSDDPEVPAPTVTLPRSVIAFLDRIGGEIEVEFHLD